MISTLPTQPPAISVKTVWDDYFLHNHAEVVSNSIRALYIGNAPDYLHVTGLSLLSQNKISEGICVLKTALLLYPNSPNWFINSSVAALEVSAFEDALNFSLLGLEKHNDPILHFTLGNAFMKLNRVEEAQQCFVNALNLKPDLHDAKMNLANVRRRLGDTYQALHLYTQVINAQPSNTVALINRASVLAELNEYDEAAMLLIRIMASNHIPEASFLMATLRLADGDFENGFDLYRNRFDCSMASADKIHFTKPLIENIDQAKNAHVLVSHEQGFGDSIQFIRYLSMIADKSKKVSLLIPKELHRLFANVDTRVNIVSSRDGLDYDIECPMLHLPYIFKTTIDTIPNTIPYLHVSNKISLESKHKKVGVVWAGQLRENADLAAVDKRRSLSYNQIETLFDVKNIDFYSLQVGHDEISNVKSILPTNADFADTAAAIMQLDLVITVDTAVAHLAAALGKQVWMLSRFDQCWRWMRNTSSSPWYPNVLEIFYQEERGNWIPTIEKMKVALEAWAK